MSRAISRRQRANPTAHRARINRFIAPALESLETRQLLSTSVWTGAGGNNLFSNGANWQGGTAPASGDDIVLNDLGSQQTIDVGSAVTVGNIYAAGEYAITDQTLTINGGVEAEANANLAFNNTITPTANNHFTADAGATLTLHAISYSSSQTFDKYGDGTLSLNDRSNGATWQMLAGTMELDIQDSINLIQYAGTVVPDYPTGTIVQNYEQDGGTLDLTTPISNGFTTLSVGDNATLNSGTVKFLVNSSGNAGINSGSGFTPVYDR